MKKIISISLVVLLSLGFVFATAAAELTRCSVIVESATAEPGSLVTVAVRMENNSGFTNFGIGLAFDSEQLTLISLEPVLCKDFASVNTHWESDDGKILGYVDAACAEAVKENGVLFTATFQVGEDCKGKLDINAVVSYIRNNEAVFSIFEEIHGEVTSGVIMAARRGDINDDGIVEYNDVMLAYKAYLGEITLTEEQLAAVDENGNGTVEEAEYQKIYQIYFGG